MEATAPTSTFLGETPTNLWLVNVSAPVPKGKRMLAFALQPTTQTAAVVFTGIVKNKTYFISSMTVPNPKMKDPLHLARLNHTQVEQLLELANHYRFKNVQEYISHGLDRFHDEGLISRITYTQGKASCRSQESPILIDASEVVKEDLEDAALTGFDLHLLRVFTSYLTECHKLNTARLTGIGAPLGILQDQSQSLHADICILWEPTSGPRGRMYMHPIVKFQSKLLAKTASPTATLQMLERILDRIAIRDNSFGGDSNESAGSPSSGSQPSVHLSAAELEKILDSISESNPIQAPDATPAAQSASSTRSSAYLSIKGVRVNGGDTLSSEPLIWDRYSRMLTSNRSGIARQASVALDALGQAQGRLTLGDQSAAPVRPLTGLRFPRDNPEAEAAHSLLGFRSDSSLTQLPDRTRSHRSQGSTSLTSRPTPALARARSLSRTPRTPRSIDEDLDWRPSRNVNPSLSPHHPLSASTQTPSETKARPKKPKTPKAMECDNCGISLPKHRRITPDGETLCSRCFGFLNHNGIHRIVPPDDNNIDQCTVCGTRSSPQWRWDKQTGNRVCNKCHSRSNYAKKYPASKRAKLPVQGPNAPPTPDRRTALDAPEPIRRSRKPSRTYSSI